MFIKMFMKWLWAWWLTGMVLAEGEFDGVLQMVQKQASIGDKARSQWAYQPHEDGSHRQTSEGISHGYAAHSQENAFKVTEPHSEYPAYSASPLPEYWANLTMASGSAYTYSRPYLASTTSGSGPPSASRGTPTLYQYLPIRSPSPGQLTLKKFIPHYHIPKHQLHAAHGFSKANHKKTLLYHSPPVAAPHNKSPHLKVHKPYAKHKYPMRKTPQSPYRKYYQSPYQKYAIPFPLQVDYTQYKTTASSSSSSSSDGYRTTERMDDAYPDGSAPAEDYINYNTTANYYDAYDEPHRPPLSASNDPTATRGYYGDRIYMSTHLDKPPNPDTYFILRRTSDDYDIFD